MADIKDMEQLNNTDTEIKETTGSSVEIYDEDDDIELTSPKKPKKKIKKKWIALGIAVLLIAFFVVRGVVASKNNIMAVETMSVELGTIEDVLSISGTVQSADTVTLFADVAAPIDEINVKAGDKVKKGDVLYTYDKDELELSKKSAELGIKQAKGNYTALYAGTDAADRKYAEGMTPQQINDRLDAITAEIDSLNNKVTEKTNRINQTLKDIQNTQVDINQDGVYDGNEAIFHDEYDEDDEDFDKYSYLKRRENSDDKNASSSNRQMKLALEQTYNDVSYALKTDAEIKAWNDQITALEEERSHLSSAKAAQVNPGTAQSTKASLEQTELTNEDKIAKIDEAMGGVKADFNAVVTEVAVVEGATVTGGTKTLALANLDDVQVSVSVSKSDLPKISVGQKVDITINGKAYQGEVIKISGSATKNSNGVAVVDTTIKVTNPDSDIILGVEANNKIHGDKADNTIVLPYEDVLTDADGDYVYVVEDGVVARRNVTIGISTSTHAQIKEGLSVGDNVITTNLDTLTEGMPVAVTGM